MKPDINSRRQTAWRILLILLLALIVGRFVVVGMPKVLFNQVSSDGDESAYLSLGLALRESGTLSDGTRPPLYSLLLSPFAAREWSYFTTAKLLTLGMGALAVLAVFAAGVRLFSWETALLAAFLLATNKEFHLRATTVYADTLLTLIMAGSWYYLIKSLAGWKNCILAGVFVGLAFLTKGSAPILLAAWGLTALLHYRLNIFRRLELLLVPLLFIITALPLLIYNANEFGSPTYNFATEHVMWLDRWEQRHTAVPENLPTFSSYVATHNPTDVSVRIQRGLRRFNPIVARTLIPGRAFEPAWLGSALGVLALGMLILLIGFKRQALAHYLAKHKNTLLFSFFLFSLFYTLFTWYVAGSVAETRFVIPLLGPLYLLLADVIVSLTRGVGSSETRFFQKTGFLLAAYRLALALVIGWGAWWLVNSSRAEVWALTVDPYESDRSANAEVEAIIQWLSRDNPTGEASVIFGPSKSLPIWKFPPHFTFERLPYEINTWPAMQTHLQTKMSDYIIIDDDTVRRRRDALSGHFQRDNGLVRFEQVPPGWALDFVYPSIPCRWCIFSPVSSTQPIATLEDRIELLSVTAVNGSGIEPTNVLSGARQRIGPPANAELSLVNAPARPFIIHPGRHHLRVTLSWRTRTPLPDDYTVFVHLTAPDGFVKAQYDQQPFAGARPTSTWQPGEVLADRYDFLLDDSITAGDYLLLTGMYDPTTGERLAVIEGPTGPAPNTILLGSLQIK